MFREIVSLNKEIKVKYFNGKNISTRDKLFEVQIFNKQKEPREVMKVTVYEKNQM